MENIAHFNNIDVLFVTNSDNSSSSDLLRLAITWREKWGETPVILSTKTIKDLKWPSLTISSLDYPIKSNFDVAKTYTVFDFLQRANKKFKFKKLVFVDCTFLSFFCVNAKRASLDFEDVEIILVENIRISSLSSEEEFMRLISKIHCDVIYNLNLDKMVRSPSQYKKMKSPRPISEEPPVTVCIPHYRRWNYLCEALLSLNGQTSKNFKVIVVDDSSNENLEQLKFISWANMNLNFQMNLFDTRW